MLHLSNIAANKENHLHWEREYMGKNLECSNKKMGSLRNYDPCPGILIENVNLLLPNICIN
jgi:hypothetical protein